MTPVCDGAAIELLEGRWKGPSSEETWTRVGEALVGLAFSKGGGFEVLSAGPVDGVPTYVARPSGGAPTPFPCAAAGEGTVTFTNPAHDFPQRITYSRRGKRMTAGIGLVEGEDRGVFKWKAADLAPVPEVEAAERAFALDSAERGAAAWVDVWHPEGTKWNGDGVVDRAGLAASMEPLLSAGKLAWEPVASGLDPWDDDRAFTVGTWTFTGGERVATGWYATIWRREGDRWLVEYDVGS